MNQDHRQYTVYLSSIALIPPSNVYRELCIAAQYTDLPAKKQQRTEKKQWQYTDLGITAAVPRTTTLVLY